MSNIPVVKETMSGTMMTHTSFRVMYTPDGTPLFIIVGTLAEGITFGSIEIVPIIRYGRNTYLAPESARIERILCDDSDMLTYMVNTLANMFTIEKEKTDGNTYIVFKNDERYMMKLIYDGAICERLIVSINHVIDGVKITALTVYDILPGGLMTVKKAGNNGDLYTAYLVDSSPLQMKIENKPSEN